MGLLALVLNVTALSGISYCVGCWDADAPAWRLRPRSDRRRARLQQLRLPDRRARPPARWSTPRSTRASRFFDTADVYGNRGGSEEFIGRALAGRRDQVVLATKFGSDLGDGETARGARPYIRKAIEASLRAARHRLVDLYQYHRPDGVTPIEETLGAMDELVAGGQGALHRLVELHGGAGRGGRRDRAPSAADAVRLRAERVLAGSRASAERELLPVCERLGIGFMPYFPLASGLLTGKYRRGEPAPEGTRLHGREHRRRATLDRVERLEAFATRAGRAPARGRDRRAAAQPAVASVIAGATKPEQVRANAAAGEWVPSAEDLAALTSL